MKRDGLPPISRDDIGFLLSRASRRWNEALYEMFCEADIPESRPAYGPILIPLFEEDGLRMGELARRAGLSKQTMTTMIVQIEKSGLIERRPDPEDGRASRIFLTAEARRRQGSAQWALHRLEERAAAALAPQSLEELRRALRRLAEARG